MLIAYKEAIASLCELQDNYDRLDIQISTLNRNKRRVRKKIQSVESDRDELKIEVSKKLLANKKSEFNYLLDKAEEAKLELQKLQDRMDKELSDIKLDRFDEMVELDVEILSTLSDTFAFLSKELPEIVGRYSYDYDICLENLDNLANKCGTDGICKPIKSRVYALIDLEEENDKSIFEKVLDKMIGVPKDVEFDTKYRVIVLSSYLGVIALAFLNFSFLILGAIGLGIKSVYENSREGKYKNKCIQYLEDFKSMYQILFNSLKEKKDKYIEEEKDRIASKYLDIVKEVTAKIESNTKDYEIRTKSIVVSDEEINQAVDVEFSNKIEELNNDLAEYENQIRAVLENQQKCENDLEEVQNRISSLRDSISEVYWELTSVGLDKVLMKEFFLGFKDYDLISVKYDGNAMAIVYDGESSERNSVLISMFIAQLFSNMLPNSLNLTIVDIDYTCRDYSIYNGGIFDLLFNFITTEDKIGAVIESLHADLIRRQSEISPISDTIDEFNKMMISRNSFTKEYSFVIFQNAKEEYLKNQKLLQLCRTGKSFGIIPIIFINKELYENISKSTDSKLMDCKPIIDSLSEYSWKFKQDTLDLEKI